ncbi:MAG: primosomal protein N', partial [Gammaproteobacteria bacterium]
MNANFYLRVAVPSPLYKHFDYLPPADTDISRLTPGIRVRVPFGGRDVIGILLDTPARTEVPASKLKRVRRILDTAPLIPEDMLALACWAAEYYRHPIGEVMQALLPVALRQGKPAQASGTTVWRMTADGSQADPVLLQRAPQQAVLLAALREHRAGCDATQLAAILDHWSAAVRALSRRGWVEKSCREIEADARTDPTPALLSLNSAQAHAAAEVIAAAGSFHAF